LQKLNQQTVRLPVDNAARHSFPVRALLPAKVIGTDVAAKETPFEIS
jgi:hypothetical protein